MEGKGIAWGMKAFGEPTWELPTEAVWPHLMFYSLSLPTLLQTFKLHFLLELSSAHIHTNLSNRLIPVLCYSGYSSKHRGPDISTTGYGELRVQAQEGNSWVILWFCFEFLRTLQTDVHNGHINLHPQQCIRFHSLPIFSNTDGRFLDDIHSDWDEVGRGEVGRVR